MIIVSSDYVGKIHTKNLARADAGGGLQSLSCMAVVV